MSATARPPRKRFSRAQVRAREYWRGQLAERADEAHKLCWFAAKQMWSHVQKVLRCCPEMDSEDLIQGALLRIQQCPPAIRNLEFSTWIVNGFRFYLHGLLDRRPVNARHLGFVSGVSRDGISLIDLRGELDPPLGLAGVASEVHEALERLASHTTGGDRARRILELRHGLRGETPHTLDECSVVLGISKERVRQIEALALKFLWTRLRSYRPQASSREAGHE